jgi:predicted nuclease of predicted toxin-antitoxin system
MKLLFDENLSPKLPRLLAALFPDSAHVRDCGLKGQPDESIWEYARHEGFILVSKDSDFYQRSLLYGHPPRLIWLCIGNCTREDLVALLTKHRHEILALDSPTAESILILLPQRTPSP